MPDTQPSMFASHPAYAGGNADSASGGSSSSSNNLSPADATPENYRNLFDARSAHTKFVDPCDEARQRSMKCLDKNNYKREACTEFFQAYRDCKKTWMEQRREDRRNGLDASG